MEKHIRKFGVLALALLLVLGGCLWFARQKSGLFIDEVYSYGLSNSHYAPFLSDVVGGDLHDQMLSRQQLMDYLVVNEGETADFGSVYHNQVHDVHPPLYYWLLNLVCSLTPGMFSLWSGLLLDLLIYLYAAALLYFLTLTLFGDRLNAALIAVLYGLSMLGLSTMLMIRMYVLMTALTVQLALIVAKLMREPKRTHYPLLCLTLFLGLMTQYYFVFYAFFLCAAYVIRALIKKEWTRALRFALWAFAGVGLLLLAFPACLDHLFADKLVSGGNALDNLRDLSQYGWRLGSFFRTLVHGLHAAVLVGLFTVLAVLLMGRALRRGGVIFSADSLVILIPTVPTLLLVAVISPVVEIRYVYNIVPILVLWIALFLDPLRQLPKLSGRAPRLVFCAAVLLLALWQARAVPPEYLYIEYRDYDAAAAAHSEAPCLYLDDGYFAPITEDIQQLLYFDTFFVTSDPASPALTAYLAGYPDAEEAVVYVDVSRFWSSGFNPDEMLPRLLESTGFTEYRPLYTTGLSETYLLTK